MKSTTYDKAQDLAWRYLRMAKQHVQSKNTGKLMEIGPWAGQFADLPYVATSAVINQAKQSYFYDQALQLLATMPAQKVVSPFTSADLEKFYLTVNQKND